MDVSKALQCMTVDSLGKACMAQIKEASKWCPRHDEVAGEMFLSWLMNTSDILNFRSVKNYTMDTKSITRRWMHFLRRRFAVMQRLFKIVLFMILSKGGVKLCETSTFF